MVVDHERSGIGISREGLAVLQELHFHEDDGSLPIEEQYQDIECDHDPALTDIIGKLFQEYQVRPGAIQTTELDIESYRLLKLYLSDKNEAQKRAIEKRIVVDILHRLSELSKNVNDALQSTTESGSEESAISFLDDSHNLLYLLGEIQKLFDYSNSLSLQYTENLNHDLLAAINNLSGTVRYRRIEKIPKLIEAVRVNGYIVNAHLFALHESEKNPESITRNNIQDILDKTAERWGYGIEIVNEIPQHLQSEKIYVCIDQQTLAALADKDAASILYMIFQQIKNSSRINLSVAFDEAEAKKIKRSDPEFPWDKARPPIVLSIELKEQGVQISIQDSGIGLSYDDAIETFMKTLAIKKKHGLATPGDLFLLAVMEDEVLRAHIPEERLLQEVLKRGTSIDPHGTGIGLSQLQEMVKRNKGELIVSSLPGQGFSLNIFFPKDDQSITSSRDVRIKRFDVACRELLKKTEFHGRFLTSHFITKDEDGLKIVEFYSLTPDESELSTEALVDNFRQENIHEQAA